MNEPLPVMVWIHGGKFESGAGGTDLYHGSVLAAEGQVVVVTINYRLGALGFLATAKLDGNMGFQAQRLALQWVQKNIAGFGGNPGRVTIFGENAGSTSVAAHVASPASKGLFHAAIVQSDPWPARLKTRARGQDTAYRFAKALACDVNDVACMRSKSVDEVYHAQNVANGQFFPLHIFDGFMHWTPTVGTPELPEQPMQTIMHNRHNNVPMMLGSVQEEAVEFIMGGKAINKVSYAGILLGLYHTRAKDVMELYPLPKDSDDCRMIFASVITDHLFACAHRRAARAVVDTAGHAYLYRYNQTLSFDGWGKMQYCNGHACHGVELPYLFNTVEEVMQVQLTPGEKKLALLTGQYWSNFAHSGNPNDGPSSVAQQWPGYSADGEQEQVLQAPGARQTPHLDKKQCDFWDTMFYDEAEAQQRFERVWPQVLSMLAE